MDKNAPNEDENVLNGDSRDHFVSWGKNFLERLNHDMEYFGAYTDIKYSFSDRCDPKRRINIPNIDIFVSFASGGKNPLDRGNHIMDYIAAYENKFRPFQYCFDLNKVKYDSFLSQINSNRGFAAPITSRADPYTD